MRPTRQTADGKFNENVTISHYFRRCRIRFARHIQGKACFCPRLFVHLTSSNILPLGKLQASLLLPATFRTF